MKKHLPIFLLLFSLQSFAQILRVDNQGVALSGVLKEDHDITKPIPWARIVLVGSDVETYSDGRGFFVLGGTKGRGGDGLLEITADGYETLSYPVTIGGGEELGLIFLKPLLRVVDPITVNDLMPSRPEAAGYMIGDMGAAALFWADDPIAKAARLNLGLMGYKMRGYNWMNTEFQINGAIMNEPELGYAFAGLFAGLNDFTHKGTGTQRILSDLLSYGDIGGSSAIYINPLEYRQQFRASYSFSNSLFTNQLTAGYATGTLPSGWALNAMVSARNGAGFADGTNYKGFSYLFAAAKDLDGSYVSFYAMGAPTTRGTTDYSVQDAYDIAGTNFYNPNWGMHQGSERNARQRQYHRPVLGLQHYWEIDEDMLLRTSIAYSFGKQAQGGLNWNSLVSDPRPNTYPNIPDPFKLSDRRQINWDGLYATNDTASTGAHYISEQHCVDRSLFSFNTVFDMENWGDLAPSAGLDIQLYNGTFYKELDDLLGGAFWTDRDKFAEGVVPPSPDYYQNNMINPSAPIAQGQRFGYSYGIDQQSYRLWTRWKYIWGRYKFSVGGSGSLVSFSHSSNMTSGKTLSVENSSASKSFFNFSYKAGVAYKIDPNSDIELNTMQARRAPLFTNAFLAPRIGSVMVDNLKNETIMGGELNYTFANSLVSAEASLFYTRFLDQSIVRSYYDQDYSSYMNMALTGVNQQHIGVDASASFRITPRLKANALVSYGIYKYTSDPTAVMLQENLAKRIVDNDTVQMNGIYVAATPQMVLSGGVTYDYQHWWAGIKFNYAGNNYTDVNPLQRSLSSFSIDANKPSDLSRQDKLPGMFTIDINGGYTFMFGQGQQKAIAINANVQNLLGSKGYLGGYRPFGIAPAEGADLQSKFNTRYAYAYGRTMFLTLSFIF